MDPFGRLESVMRTAELRSQKVASPLANDWPSWSLMFIDMYLSS